MPHDKKIKYSFNPFIYFASKAFIRLGD